MNGEPDLYIGGRWRHASDGGTRDIVNPADGSVAAVVDEATDTDARDAVGAARAAFDEGSWPATPVAERSALLDRIADLLQRDKEKLASLETRDTGKTLVESRIDIDDVTSVFRYYAKLVGVEADRVIDVGDATIISRVVREPIGVCVLIAPWNYPLLQMSWKVAPALGAGCTMVAKPSEVTPLSTIAFVHLLEEAGVPGGVVNLVQGSGAALGAALTDDGRVDFISFTGGLATGRTITRVAAEHVTKVAVELGGKNPHIVFADIGTGDAWDASVDQVLTGVFLHSGQVCSAGTRLIVEESIADDFVAALVGRAEKIRMGDGMDPASETGPLVSEQHRAKVEAHVAAAISEGATLVTGGSRPTDAALEKGSFYLPTIFDRCDRSMGIVQEETFGPILTVERFTDEAEAIRLGNDTEYGLAAGVRTSDPARGERVVRALRHGTVWLNDFGYYTAAAEWGGFGKSGNGRELGPTGLAEYQELKHIWQNTAPKPAGWFKGE
ncbi:betaine-aldehyde dehydrogenase [Mycobacterium antarcticum]|uniref:aldehyde dehydrogenase family protein n=1 Tax=unclassified Mycolicibacterium TaxID=2636767 RepID=UPI00239C0F33|nr:MULTISPECIES: aldehyde dehydrogenase family protein [unclassified Mycolicibacterium]BDX30046.1 betaine-aldehyde dehydrogenase [Mycolicibacterium sp. TUM20985]GLP79181.1 betaine-aldehyde dehydrogenase [Mycolicibacterium sp. TUM20984]